MIRIPPEQEPEDSTTPVVEHERRLVGDAEVLEIIDRERIGGDHLHHAADRQIAIGLLRLQDRHRAVEPARVEQEFGSACRQERVCRPNAAVAHHQCRCIPGARSRQLPLPPVLGHEAPQIAGEDHRATEQHQRIERLRIEQRGRHRDQRQPQEIERRHHHRVRQPHGASETVGAPMPASVIAVR